MTKSVLHKSYVTRGWLSGSSCEAVAPVCTMAYPRDWLKLFRASSLVILNVDWPYKACMYDKLEWGARGSST